MVHLLRTLIVLPLCHFHQIFLICIDISIMILGILLKKDSLIFSHTVVFEIFIFTINPVTN